MPHASKPDNRTRWMRLWLIAIALMVYAMILIGGATRLTDSGLSITEWEPISGALPPMSDAAWQEEFLKYQQTSEYRFQNAGMSLGEFQYIFFWEWGHRQFGRLIGLVAILGFAAFWMKGWLAHGYAKRFALLIGLGALQGAIGWWMVSSGIGETERIDVAPYRLMTHFVLALIIIGYAYWLWLDLGATGRRARPPILAAAAPILLILVTIQMASGALVAGLDAGRTYTDWPLMAGEVFPSGYVNAELGIRSLFEGRAATQFNHRALAYLLWAASIGAAILAWRSEARSFFAALAALVTLQAIWGIITLVHTAPLDLALVHQGLGVIVFLAAVRLNWATGRPTAKARAMSA